VILVTLSTHGTQAHRDRCAKTTLRPFTCAAWLTQFMVPRRSRFRGRHVLRSEKAMPPQDYTFENLALSASSKRLRRMLSTSVMTALLLIALVVTLGLKAVERQQQVRKGCRP